MLSLVFIVSTKANEFAIDTDGHRITFLYTSTVVYCAHTYKELILYIKKEKNVKNLFLLAEEQYQLVTYEENSLQILFT